MTERSGAKAGFTLFELLLVLSIISVAMAVVLPSMSAGFSVLRAKSAALDMSAEIARARERSVRERRAYSVEAVEGALIIRSADGKTSSNEAPAGVQVEPAEAITFSPEGVSSGGQITLRTGDSGFVIKVLANGRTFVDRLK